MCSLGRHQEGDDIRPSRYRRHSDGSASGALAATSRQELMARRKQKRAELEALKLEKRGADFPPEPDQFHLQFEPLPPGADILMDREPVAAEQPFWAKMP